MSAIRPVVAVGVLLVLALVAGQSWWVYRQREIERQVFNPALARVETALLLRERDPASAKAELKSAIGILYRQGLLDDAERGSVFDEGLRRLETRLVPSTDLVSIFNDLERRTVNEEGAAAQLPSTQAVKPPIDIGHPAGEELSRPVDRKKLAEDAILCPDEEMLRSVLRLQANGGPQWLELITGPSAICFFRSWDRRHMRILSVRERGNLAKVEIEFIGALCLQPDNDLPRAACEPTTDELWTTIEAIQ